MTTARAIVLGGGIAGLSAALALRRAGWAVELFEQAPALQPLGAAISLWPNAMAALRLLGVAAPIEAAAVPIAAMLLATQAGRPLLGPWPVDAARHGETAYLPTRALVQQVLFDALTDVPVRLARRAESVRDLADRAVVRLDDGEEREADLLVAADGIWSSIGTTVARNPPRPCGYGGVLALSDAVAGEPLDGLAAEYWGAAERFGVFDLGAGRRYWFFMARDGAVALDHGSLTARARDWPASVGAAIAATPPERLLPVSISARPAPSRLAQGRVIAVGDAAHAMEPNLGQGACQAIEDAAALGVLAARLPPDEVGAAFDRARRGRVTGMMARAREGGWAAHGSTLTRAAWRTMFRLTPPTLHRRMIAGLYRPPTITG